MPISMSDSEGTNHQLSYPVLFHVHGGSTEGIEELPQQMEGDLESTSLETGNEQQGGQAEIENSHPREM